MGIFVLRGIHANQRAEGRGLVHIAVIPISSADVQAVNPFRILHEILFADLPAQTYRPEGCVTVFRVIGNQIGSIRPHASRHRVFLVQSVSCIRIQREIAVAIVGIAIGILEGVIHHPVREACPVQCPGRTIWIDSDTQSLIAVTISTGIVGCLRYPLSDFSTQNNVQRMTVFEYAVKIQLVTEVVRRNFLLAFLFEAAFCQIGGYHIGCLVPRGSRVNQPSYRKGVFIVDVRVKGVVHLVLNLRVKIQSFQQMHGQAALYAGIELLVTQIPIFNLRNRVVAPITIWEILCRDIPVQHLRIKAAGQLRAVAVLIHQHIIRLQALDAAISDREEIARIARQAGCIDAAVLYLIILHHAGEIKVQPFEQVHIGAVIHHQLVLVVLLKAIPFPFVHQRKHVIHPLVRAGNIDVVLLRHRNLQQVFLNLFLVVLAAQLFQRRFQVSI